MIEAPSAGPLGTSIIPSSNGMRGFVVSNDFSGATTAPQIDVKSTVAQDQSVGAIGQGVQNVGGALGAVVEIRDHALNQKAVMQAETDHADVRSQVGAALAQPGLDPRDYEATTQKIIDDNQDKIFPTVGLSPNTQDYVGGRGNLLTSQLMGQARLNSAYAAVGQARALGVGQITQLSNDGKFDEADAKAQAMGEGGSNLLGQPGVQQLQSQVANARKAAGIKEATDAWVTAKAAGNQWDMETSAHEIVRRTGGPQKSQDAQLSMLLATGTKAVQTTLATNQNHADTDWIGKLGLLRANGAQSDDLSQMATALEDKKVISGQAGAHMTTMLGNATGATDDQIQPVITEATRFNPTTDTQGSGRMALTAKFYSLNPSGAQITQFNNVLAEASTDNTTDTGRARNDIYAGGRAAITQVFGKVQSDDSTQMPEADMQQRHSDWFRTQTKTNNQPPTAAEDNAWVTANTKGLPVDNLWQEPVTPPIDPRFDFGVPPGPWQKWDSVQPEPTNDSPWAASSPPTSNPSASASANSGQDSTPDTVPPTDASAPAPGPQGMMTADGTVHLPGSGSSSTFTAAQPGFTVPGGPASASSDNASAPNLDPVAGQGLPAPPQAQDQPAQTPIQGTPSDRVSTPGTPKDNIQHVTGGITATLDSPEFAALPPETRRQLTSAMLRSAAQTLGNAGWTPDSYAAFTHLAAKAWAKTDALKTTLESAKPVVEGVAKSLAATAASAVDAVAIHDDGTLFGKGDVSATAAKGFVPGLKHYAGLAGEAVARSLGQDAPLQQATSKMFDAIDQGQIPFDKINDWVSQQSRQIEIAQARFYAGARTLGLATEISPEDRQAAANNNLTSPNNAALLKDYLMTRNPQAKAALMNNLYTTALQTSAKADKQAVIDSPEAQRAAAKFTLPQFVPGVGGTQLLGAHDLVEVGDPVNVATTVLPVMRALKFLSPVVREGIIAGLSTTAAQQAAFGALKYAGDNPNFGFKDTAQAALEQAAVGTALHLGTAGAAHVIEALGKEGAGLAEPGKPGDPPSATETQAAPGPQAEAAADGKTGGATSDQPTTGTAPADRTAPEAVSTPTENGKPNTANEQASPEPATSGDQSKQESAVNPATGGAETHHSAFADHVPGDAPVKDASERRAENAQLLLSNPTRKSPPSDVARVHGNDEHAQAIRKGLLLSDQAHDDGDLPPLDIGRHVAQAEEGDRHGTYSPGGDGLSAEANVGTNTGRPLNVTLHEFGHHIWEHALSEAQRNAITDAARNTLTYERIAGSKMTPKDIQYMLEPKEIFARAYAQWVAEKTGDVEAKTELAKMAATPQAKNHRWSPGEFKGISTAIEKIFKSKGWL